MGALTSSTVLYFVWTFLLLPKIRSWRLVIASSSSSGVSFLACIVRARACVAFTILSDGVTVGVFIVLCLNLKVSVIMTAPFSVTVLMT